MDLKQFLFAPVLAVATTILSVAPFMTAQSSLLPGELIRRTVKNELSFDNKKFMFRDQKSGPHGSQTKLIVQTRQATAGMLIQVNGKPLGPDQRQQEQARLQKLANDPDALQHKLKQEKEDADHVSRIMKALPDAFLYEPDGTEVGKGGLGKEGDELVRLKFRPNPKYDPPSHTEQVLTGMQGYMLVDANKQRLARIDGTLFKDVGFGWGILGHLDKGGRFVVTQGDVGPDHWEVTQMHLDFTGKIMMFKNLTIKSDDTFSDFRPVPDDLTFAQAIELLKKQEDTLAENHSQSGNTK
jgi:hypothetical protein